MTDQVGGPLGKIALGLSGGGFRAAAFHLGTLDVLHAVGLIEDVAAISTVSGGTFVGAAYALAAARAEGFPAFYTRFYRQLGQRPLDRALVLLKDKEVEQLPAPTLIAAHAEVYDEVFFHGARFSEILDRPSHLQEIAFNATDFCVGLPFRFQCSLNGRVRIGNGRHSIPRKAARQMRIADIVAASSCFPGGFEPIRFPDDFSWEDLSQLRRDLGRQAAKFEHPVCLMDGGVADNQGISSLTSGVRRIDRAGEPRNRVGLIVISDTDRPVEGRLLELNETPKRGRFRVRHLVMLAWLLFFAAMICLAGAVYRLGAILMGHEVDWLREVLPQVFAIVFSSAVMIVLPMLLNTLHKQLERQLRAIGLTDDFRIELIRFIHHLPVTLLLDWSQMRLASLLTMANNVFMKSIRDLRYKMLFSDDRYRDRSVANLIYELAAGRYRHWAHLPDWLEPSPQIREMAEAAKNMATILWFEYPEQLPRVVACGRHTTCYNLLTHLTKRYGPDLQGADEKTRAAFARARTLWQRFQIDPLLQTETCLEIQ